MVLAASHRIDAELLRRGGGLATVAPAGGPPSGFRLLGPYPFPAGRPRPASASASSRSTCGPLARPAHDRSALLPRRAGIHEN